MKPMSLSDIAEVNPGMNGHLKPSDLCSFVPMESVDETLGEITSSEIVPVAAVAKGYTPFRQGDVLFAKITPCMENGKCAVAKDLTNGIGFGSTEFHVIRPRDVVIADWIFYFLRQPSVREQAEHRMTGTAGQRRVPASVVEEMEIPLPSLAEQRRIAALQRAADDERRRRRYTQTLSDGLAREVFVRMFGDPATNPMGWEVYPVEYLLSPTRKGIQTGPFGSALKRHEYVDSGIAVWGIDNVTAYGFEEDAPLYITAKKFDELSSYSVEDGDILISRAGTVGRMCVAHPSKKPSIIGTNLVRVSVNENRVLPDYFVTLFTAFRVATTQLRASGDESAYSFMNPDTLQSTLIMVPSLAAQHEFVVAKQRHARIRDQQQESARQSEHLFETLLHRAFAGEM